MERSKLAVVSSVLAGHIHTCASIYPLARCLTSALMRKKVNSIHPKEHTRASDDNAAACSAICLPTPSYPGPAALAKKSEHAVVLPVPSSPRYRVQPGLVPVRSYGLAPAHELSN
jgi:hypothetical protein